MCIRDSSNTVPGNYARAMSNSIAMYTGGSGAPIDKFTFATTTNSLFSTLPVSQTNAGAASHQAAGYWFFGKTPSGQSNTSKLNFNSGTISMTTTTSNDVPNMQYVGATSARSDANAGTSGPTIL